MAIDQLSIRTRQEQSWQWKLAIATSIKGLRANRRTGTSPYRRAGVRFFGAAVFRSGVLVQLKVKSLAKAAATPKRPQARGVDP
jgi:hypothetical protein